MKRVCTAFLGCVFLSIGSVCLKVSLPKARHRGARSLPLGKEWLHGRRYTKVTSRAREDVTAHGFGIKR